MVKNAPKKAAKQPEPMDPAIRENKTPAQITNQQRVCYSAKTLVAEVGVLFPETPVEYSNIDGRNTALDVTFDLSVLDERDRNDLMTAFRLLDDPAYNEDRRIAEVLVDIEQQQVLVSFRSNPRTQDSREPFGLIDAMSVLSGQDEFHYGDEDEPDFEGGGSL